MGLCVSCCKGQSENVYEEHNDKSNLLGNPVGEGSRSTSNGASNKYGKEIGNQQEKLNEILQKTANSYIDVPALNSPVDQSQPVDKTKDYNTKLQIALKNREYGDQPSLLKDVPQIEGTLSEEPLVESDVKMVKKINASILEALQSLEIDTSENLVIPFNAAKQSQ